MKKTLFCLLIGVYCFVLSVTVDAYTMSDPLIVTPQSDGILLFCVGMVGLAALRRMIKRAQVPPLSVERLPDTLTQTERATLIWHGSIPLRFSWDR